MPDIRLFADEQVSRAIVLGLRQRGVEILSTPEAGRAGLSDEDHLDFARDNGYVVLTEDQDFLMLEATRPDHGGVIYARQGKKIGDVIRGVLLVTDTLVATEMVGQVQWLGTGETAW